MTSKQQCIHRAGCAAYQGECERVGYCLGRELRDAVLPPLPKHDHAFQDPEGEEPDILVWNAASMRAYALAARRAHETECAHCREVFEIYAGMDGFRPETAPEGYQQRIIEQMRDAALKGLKATTPRGFLGSTPDGGIDDADRT